MDAASRVSVLVADDHALVRDGLMRMINGQPDMVVVGEARNGDEAIVEAQRLSPMIMLLDVSMPGPDGVVVAQALADACPQVKIIAVTRHTEQAFVSRIFAAGAAGYVLKQSVTTELLPAVRAVADGEQYLDATLRPALGTEPHRPRQVAVRGNDDALNPTEQRVLQLFARAHSDHDIAHTLGLPFDQVARVKSEAMRKTGIRTRIDAMEYAKLRGWS